MTAATGIGARVLRTEDKRFLTGTGRYVDDLPLARATYAYFLRSPHAHAKIKSIDTAAAKAMPGVVDDLHRQGHRRRQGRRPDLRLGGQGQARPAAQGAAASGDGGRHRPLCRRHGGDGRGQQPRRGQGRRRGDQGRLRREARQRRSRQGARQGRARGPRRSAGQPDLRLGDRREGRCRCRVRQGRARHQARPRQQPPDPQRHGAARRGGGVRQGHGQLHAVVDVAEPARAAPHPVGLRAGHSRAQAARHRARRGRRLRQQDLLLQRRDHGHAGRRPASAGRSSGRPSAASRS